MAWNTSTVCACNWDADFGSADNCSPQVPGFNRTVLALCLDKLDTITRVAASDADADASGVISDIAKAAGEVANIMFCRDDSILFESTESINDNGGKDVNEVFTGQGLISAAGYNFLRAHLDKEIILVGEDNDENLVCIGHDGGFKLSTFTHTFGQQQGDFKGVNFTFSNTKRSPFEFIDLDILGTYADNAAFFSYLTT